MRTFFAGLFVVMVPLPLVVAQPPGPAVTIQLGTRQGRVIPARHGFSHTGGGNIDMAQPSADTVVITMTGVAVAGAHPLKDSVATLNFDLFQALEVSFEKPQIRKARLTIEGRVIGLLRSHAGGGCAALGSAHAAVLAGGAELV